ncbi:MAG TPA: trypco2 family protein [Acidimicrobiales bacterium]|nr:trypco2 family protein [Acidimicrobiales bacterium]
MDVGLGEAISKVRLELEQAIRDGEGALVAFRAGPVEMEFQVAFSRAGSGDGGVRLGVVSIGAKAELSRSATHRLKVTLTPVSRSGEDQLIGDVGDR